MQSIARTIVPRQSGMLTNSQVPAFFRDRCFDMLSHSKTPVNHENHEIEPIREVNLGYLIGQCMISMLSVRTLERDLKHEPNRLLLTLASR